jgi:hypothetical protein
MAAQGCFKNKKFAEKEKDLGVLVLKIDGPRLLTAFNKLNLLPSASAVKRMLSGNFSIAYNYEKRVQFDKNSAKIDEVIGANEEQFRLTDTFATVTKFKLGNIAVIFLVADRIIWKTKSEASIPLS